MKQFIICLIACFIFYLGCSLMVADLDISNWNPEGRTYFGFFIIVIWVLPIYWNVLNNKPNFE